jgi:hypothetical protein
MCDLKSHKTIFYTIYGTPVSCQALINAWRKASVLRELISSRKGCTAFHERHVMRNSGKLSMIHNSLYNP